METTQRTANQAIAYRVSRRTEKANRIAEQWADSLGTYWECDPRFGLASVHWVKVEGHAGWWLLNDAAAYVLFRVADEEAEAQGDYELLGWECEEVGSLDGAERKPFAPPYERVGLLPLIKAIAGLKGPGYYENAA